MSKDEHCHNVTGFSFHRFSLSRCCLASLSHCHELCKSSFFLFGSMPAFWRAVVICWHYRCLPALAEGFAGRVERYAGARQHWRAFAGSLPD